MEVTCLDNSSRAYSLPRNATAGDLVKAVVERLGLRLRDGGEEKEVTVEDLLPFFGLMESYAGAWIGSVGWGEGTRTHGMH